MLRGFPALLIILVVWLELLTRSIKVFEGISQILQRITRVDVAAIALFNLAIGLLSVIATLFGLDRFFPHRCVRS